MMYIGGSGIACWDCRAVSRAAHIRGWLDTAPHNIYLHDTPSRSLFDREQRTFSHGCIRLQNPLDLAVLILNDADRWSRDVLLAVIAEGRTRTIPLATPVPVLILYWTASADLHGELHFYRDVYGRDDSVRRGLGG